MGALTATYEPDTAQLSTTTLGTVETTHSYSAFGDLSGIDYEAANTSFYEVTYTHDDFGRVQTKTETRPGSTRLRCYEYDASDRLAAVYDAANSGGCTGSQLEAYTYDLNGNRESVTNSAGTIAAANIVTDDQDRLLQHGDFTYAYNEDGQMISRTETSSGDTWLYTYDANGNLREVDPPGVGGTISYVIDPRNRRVGRRVDGTLMQGFLYGDQLNPIAELDGSGTLISRFVYGTSDHVPDYMIRGGITYRFITDHLGSVVGVYDLTNGVEVQTREYDAYGRIVAETGSFSQPFGFAGGLYDEGTGLVRFGARDYRPEVGSWAAKDPLRFGGGTTSLVQYCFADPVNLVDRTGRVPGEPFLSPEDAAEDFGFWFADPNLSFELCTTIYLSGEGYWTYDEVNMSQPLYDSDGNYWGEVCHAGSAAAPPASASCHTHPPHLEPFFSVLGPGGGTTGDIYKDEEFHPIFGGYLFAWERAATGDLQQVCYEHRPMRKESPVLECPF